MYEHTSKGRPTVDRLLDRLPACALTVDYPRLARRRLNVSAGRRSWKSECPSPSGTEFRDLRLRTDALGFVARCSIDRAIPVSLNS